MFLYILFARLNLPFWNSKTRIPEGSPPSTDTIAAAEAAPRWQDAPECFYLTGCIHYGLDDILYVCALLPPSARPNLCSKVWAMLSSKHGWRLFGVVQSIAGSSNSNLCRSNYGDGPLISFDGLL